MSRTDKTDPWIIRVQHRRAWLVEEHHHATHECDLPDRDSEDATRWFRGACVWETSSRAWWEAGSACCCPLCRQSVTHKAENRVDRHQASRSCSLAAQLANCGQDPEEPWVGRTTWGLTPNIECQ